jgi:hypothetical protein
VLLVDDINDCEPSPSGYGVLSKSSNKATNTRVKKSGLI